MIIIYFYIIIAYKNLVKPRINSRNESCNDESNIKKFI